MTRIFKKLIALTLFSLVISPLSATQPSVRIYQGNSTICFFSDEQDTLAVTIDTERLHLQSVQGSEAEALCYFMLFSDPEVMAKYASGLTKTKEETGNLVKKWAKRWHEKDPYSAFAVLRNDTGEFMGHIVMGHGDDPGQSELAFLFVKKYWAMGFGTEAVAAVVKEYAPATVMQGYTLEGKTLEKITATARTDNLASVRILEKTGMHKIGEEEKFGSLRYLFSIDLNEILYAPEESLITD